MALSKAVKERIKAKKWYRREMWKCSQQYGPHYRIFVKVRLSISFNVQAARKDEFGEYFFPVVRIPAEYATEVINNMASGA